MTRIQIIIGSTRPGRYSEIPAQWLYKELKTTKGITPELIDLRDYPLPFFEEAASPMKLNGSYKNAAASRWAEKIGKQMRSSSSVLNTIMVIRLY